MLAEEVKPEDTLPVAEEVKLPFHMLAEEIKPEDTLPGASIYVSRRSQTGRYSPRASIYVSRRSQTGRYSPRGFHIC